GQVSSQSRSTSRLVKKSVCTDLMASSTMSHRPVGGNVVFLPATSSRLHAFGGQIMPRTRKPELTIGAACLALFVSFFLVTARAQQPAVAIDNDDIGGVVTSTNGPEAGVWVIA